MTDLLLVKPNGRSSLRVMFSASMRRTSPSDLTDPENPSVWEIKENTTDEVVGVARVDRLSNSEFELLYSQPIPEGEYTVAVAESVEDEKGVALSASSLAFSITPDVYDLVIVGRSWTSRAVLSLDFSHPIAPLPSSETREIAWVETHDHGSRGVIISRLSRASPTRVDLEFSAPGTMGAAYLLCLNRFAFRSDDGTVLKDGEGKFTVYGQGDRPRIVSPITHIDESSVLLQSTEVFGDALSAHGFPALPAAYTVDEPG